MGPRYPSALRGSGQDGEEHRGHAVVAEEVRTSQPAAHEDAQVRGDCEVSAGHRVDRHLLRQAQRGGGHGGTRGRQDPHDHLQPVEEQDSPRDEHTEVTPRLHSGRGRGAERAGPLRGGERGGRGCGCRHRRCSRDTQWHTSRGWRGCLGPARLDAAQPQAARNPLVRRWRAACEGVSEPQGARTEDDRRERGDVRHDEEGRAEHGDLQRRRNRDLQHHAPRSGVH